jgi:hypothetical protein
MEIMPTIVNVHDAETNFLKLLVEGDELDVWYS